MANYKLVFAYDGTRYKGWQKLGGNELTIQGTIEKAMEQALDYQVEIHGSGRTDAGVHAKGQVANVKVPFLLKDDFRDELNQILPEDIRLLQVDRVPGEFHSRYSAIAKTYSYRVDLREKPGVFVRKYVYHFPKELNILAMRRAASMLLGKHDFSSFTDDKSEKDKIRTISEISILEEEGVLEFRYLGDGFLQHMVRILTGTLLKVGQGEISEQDIPNILEAKERAKAGFMAPAKGLFLEHVDYD